MQDLLKQNNIALRSDIEQLQRILNEERNKIPTELNAYSDWVTNRCENIHQRVLQNLKDLDLGQEDVLKDILSSTRLVTQNFYFLDAHRVSPIVRSRTSDRLSLKLLLWLHATHPKTKNIPVALQDGEFSVWLSEPIEPIIYFTPWTSQQGVRNLPFFFHEFGHLLYACHRHEMDDLAYELQVNIGDLLQPPVERDDKYTEELERKRDVIVDTWYEWTQEFFCDAVGFVIGGPSYAYAFSMYLRMLGRSEYQVPQENLARSSHPVTWIRIQLLADRARRMSYNAVATDLEEKWNEVATALGVIEDYDGFYDPAFLPVIQQKLDDMLIETAPREFQKSEVSKQETDPTFTAPVALLNAAWQKFQDDVENYREWEENAIARFLDADF